MIAPNEAPEPRARRVPWTMLAAALAGIGCASVRLLSVPGIESAFVLGLVLPPFVAASAARYSFSVARGGDGPSAARLLARALGLALAVTAIPTAILLLNGLRTRLCEPALGIAFIALGPLVGTALGAVWGTLAGSMTRTRPGATGLALAAPFAGVVLGLHRFWSTPAIFAYTPFAGYFPGTIYDREVALPDAYLTYRAASLLAVVTLSLLFAGGYDRALGRFRPRRLVEELGSFAASMACFAGVVSVWAAGPELGHRASTRHIADTLGARIDTERCVLHVPRETPRRLRRLWALDCDFQVARIEEALGVRHEARVHAYFYRTADEKRALMGAGHTQIAKPWRAEVHVQVDSWPHPVLGHELVHVLGSRTGAGPFAISGSLYGLLPNPGLIEGLAVGTAWNVRDGLDPDQWARAMMDIGRLPRLRDVFGLGFTTLPPRNAYDAAGSFVRFVHRMHGPEAVRRMYLEGDVESALGERLESLESAWQEHLRTVPLPSGTTERARARFADRGVFSSVCPHEVAALHRDLAEDLAAGDHRAASRTCGAILAIDPADLTAAVQRVGALSTLGRAAEAEEALASLEALGVPGPTLAAARNLLADGAWSAGSLDEAARIYESLLNEPVEEDLARAIEVRRLALAQPPEQRELLRQILVGYEGQRARSEVVVHLARELGRMREDGLGAYLEARQMFFATRYDRAAMLLDRAEAKGLPSERLIREAARLRVTSLAAVGRYTEAAAALATFPADPYLAPTVEEWEERLTHMASRASRRADRTVAPMSER
jgi:hypothetical protein